MMGRKLIVVAVIAAAVIGIVVYLRRKGGCTGAACGGGTMAASQSGTAMATPAAVMTKARAASLLDQAKRAGRAAATGQLNRGLDFLGGLAAAKGASLVARGKAAFPGASQQTRTA